jgi:hypothetical protein
MSATENKKEKSWLRLPVVAASSEFLVMGYLMRQNILAYKAPQNNEGYDLICIHPDPRYGPKTDELERVRVQVKSRYATDCDRSFPVKDTSFDAFDFLIVAFLNIGRFTGKNDGSEGMCDVEFYTLPTEFIRKHHYKSSSWQKVSLKALKEEIAQYKNEEGLRLIAKALGIPKPTRHASD